ncbi:MAG: hypothetical protein ACJAVL_001228 [Bacteroidia bacterium]|jgi:hypothetical protein
MKNRALISTSFRPMPNFVERDTTDRRAVALVCVGGVGGSAFVILVSIHLS